MGTEMKGHVALITGGGRGIGEAVARRFAKAGFRIYVTSRNVAELEKVARDTGGDYDVCDVTYPEQVRDLVQKVGRVDVLVNNAGLAQSAPFLKTDLPLWRSVIDTNLTGAFLFCRAVVPGMMERKYGRIINIASIAGKRGAPYITAYAASKHGLLGFTSSLAMELHASDVMVNAICPGYVDTPMTARIIGPKPFLMSATRAAERIQRGIERNRAIIAFPASLALAMRLMGFLPDWARRCTAPFVRFRVSPQKMDAKVTGMQSSRPEPEPRRAD
jgi:NAD(P)-dependent dehydrogenase (short-subunit alcohol dehydrogenase family)